MIHKTIYLEITGYHQTDICVWSWELGSHFLFFFAGQQASASWTHSAKPPPSLGTWYSALWWASPKQFPSCWPPPCLSVEGWWGCACLTHKPRSWCDGKQATHPCFFLLPCLCQLSWPTQGFGFFRYWKVVKCQNTDSLPWLKFRCIPSCNLKCDFAQILLLLFIVMFPNCDATASQKSVETFFKCAGELGLPEILLTGGFGS